MDTVVPIIPRKKKRGWTRDSCACGREKLKASKKCGECHKLDMIALKGRPPRATAETRRSKSSKDTAKTLKEVMSRIAAELDRRTASERQVQGMSAEDLAKVLGTCKQGLQAHRDDGPGTEKVVTFRTKFDLAGNE